MDLVQVERAKLDCAGIRLLYIDSRWDTLYINLIELQRKLCVCLQSNKFNVHSSARNPKTKNIEQKNVKIFSYHEHI